MVTGVPCVMRRALILSLIVSTALSATTPTLHPDEVDEDVDMVKRLVGAPRESMLRYLLMAMSGPGVRYSQPQLLNRGVRRMGSEFLGKRSSGDADEVDWKQRETCEDGGNCEDDQKDVESTEDDLKKEQLSFTGQYDVDGGVSEEGESHDDLFNTKTKKILRGVNQHSPYRGHLNNIFSIYLPKKMGSEFLGKRMGSEFLGKRMGSEFLGKRALGSEFLGKRAMGSEFLGKRAMRSEFLDKRALGSEFLGKRVLGSEFLGKRAMGSEFLGKRTMGSEFLGKRAMGSAFLGKRAMGSEFLGKRAMGSEFLGKRAMGSEFLGKRHNYPDLEQKRAVGSEFLG